MGDKRLDAAEAFGQGTELHMVEQAACRFHAADVEGEHGAEAALLFFAIAKKQQRGFGAMLSFDVGSMEAARSLLDHVKLCSLAESLGGVETLISHPASMTH